MSEIQISPWQASNTSTLFHQPVTHHHKAQHHHLANKPAKLIIAKKRQKNQTLANPIPIFNPTLIPPSPIVHSQKSIGQPKTALNLVCISQNQIRQRKLRITDIKEDFGKAYCQKRLIRIGKSCEASRHYRKSVKKIEANMFKQGNKQIYFNLGQYAFKSSRNICTNMKQIDLAIGRMKKQSVQKNKQNIKNSHLGRQKIKGRYHKIGRVNLTQHSQAQIQRVEQQFSDRNMQRISIVGQHVESIKKAKKMPLIQVLCMVQNETDQHQIEPTSIKFHKRKVKSQFQ